MTAKYTEYFAPSDDLPESINIICNEIIKPAAPNKYQLIMHQDD